MAKFCTKCGKALEEGKVCDCQSAAQTVAVKSEQTKVVEKTTVTEKVNSNEYVSNYIDMLKGVFKCPVDTIKKYATSDNFILGLIAIALNSAVTGCFFYLLIKEALGALGMIGSLIGLGGLGGLGALTGASLEIPFMKLFVPGFIFMAVYFIVSAVMIYVLAGMVFKDEIDIKKAISLVGVCSVFTTVTTLAAIALIYIAPKYIILLLLIAGIFYLTYLAQGISKTTKIDANKLAYVFVPTIGVATFVVVYVLPKILMK